MQEPKRPKSGLDKLENNLYSRRKELVMGRQRRAFKERDFGVSDEWKTVEAPHKLQHRRPVLLTVLVASLGFFIVSAVFAFFFFFKGVDISPNNVVIQVQGPTQVGGGEKLSLQIQITNNNPVAMENADLIVEYPSGTHSASNIDVALPRDRESLGTINPGDEVRRNIEAVLFGEENSVENISIRVEYQVAGSNATFHSDKTYPLTIATSPLSLSVNSFTETVSGQEIEFTATVKSNSANIVRNAMLTVDYPFGFKFESASKDPVFSNNVWYLGDMQPESEKKIVLRGTLSGQNGEERVFRFATGIQSASDQNAIGAEFVNVPQSVFIKQPFISASLSVAGKSDNITATGGKELKADITWVNNLPTQIFDGEIDVKIGGSAFDRQSVQTDRGFYRSVDNTIIWSRDTNAELGAIPAGTSGHVAFNFTPVGLSSGSPIKNPIITLDITVRGKRLSDANVPEEIESTISKEIRVSSDLVLTSKVLHNTGPFQNTGPMPPKAEQTTTYTIVFNVINPSNDVSGGRVVMTLPPYVAWIGAISPPSEKITFSPVGGQIIWDVGDLPAGVGITSPPREVAFQITLTPSISQIGKAPIIVNEQTISGFDRFSGATLSNTRGALNTYISDPGFDSNAYLNVVP